MKLTWKEYNLLISALKWYKNNVKLSKEEFLKILELEEKITFEFLEVEKI